MPSKFKTAQAWADEKDVSEMTLTLALAIATKQGQVLPPESLVDEERFDGLLSAASGHHVPHVLPAESSPPEEA